MQQQEALLQVSICVLLRGSWHELFVLRGPEWLIKTVYFQSFSRHCQCNMFMLQDQAQRFTFISGSGTCVGRDYLTLETVGLHR